MREVAQQLAVRLDLVDQAVIAVGQHALLDLAGLDQCGPGLAAQSHRGHRHFHRFSGAAQRCQLPDVGIPASGGAVDGRLDVLRIVEQRGGGMAAQLLAGTAEKILGGRIGVFDMTAFVDQENGRGKQIESFYIHFSTYPNDYMGEIGTPVRRRPRARRPARRRGAGRASLWSATWRCAWCRPWFLPTSSRSPSHGPWDQRL